MLVKHDRAHGKCGTAEQSRRQLPKLSVATDQVGYLTKCGRFQPDAGPRIASADQAQATNLSLVENLQEVVKTVPLE